MKQIAILAILALGCGTAAKAAEGAAGLLYKEAGIAAAEAAVPAAGAAVSVESGARYDAGVTEGAWKRANLKATDGTVMAVDYVPITAPKYVMANPVWLNVWVNGGSPRIRAILTNFLVTSGGPAVVKETQQVWLTHAGNGRYTGQFQRVMLSEGVYSYGGNLYRQELVVEKDGTMLKDPINGSSSFKFQMSNSRGAAESRAAGYPGGQEQGTVWLQFRQEEPGWWTTSESDPFIKDRIEVNVRRSGFGDGFDVDFAAGFGHEMGSISYFASRYELSAMGTRVTADKWLDGYRLEGDVRLENGRSVRIRLDMEKEFNSENYVIRGPGLLLNINRFGMTGEATNTAAYPKKVIAVIATMSMALFQSPSEGF